MPAGLAIIPSGLEWTANQHTGACWKCTHRESTQGVLAASPLLVPPGSQGDTAGRGVPTCSRYCPHLRQQVKGYRFQSLLPIISGPEVQCPGPLKAPGRALVRSAKGAALRGPPPRGARPQPLPSVTAEGLLMGYLKCAWRQRTAGQRPLFHFLIPHVKTALSKGPAMFSRQLLYQTGQGPMQIPPRTALLYFPACTR